MRGLTYLCLTFLVASCVFVAASGQECRVEEGRRRQGSSFNDFSQFTTESAEECCKVCQQEEKCKSWTRDRRTKACALKDAVPELSADEDFDSGVVGGAPAPMKIPEAECFIEDGAKYGGGDVLRTSRAKNATQCCVRCEDDLDCFSWFYNKSKKRCVLNRNIPDHKFSKKVVGGTVV